MRISSAKVDSLNINWYDYETYLKDKQILDELRKPQIKEMKMPRVVVVELPKKEEPWLKPKKVSLGKVPTNVGLPQKKVPWAK